MQDINIIISGSTPEGRYGVRVESSVGVARGFLQIDLSDPKFEQAIITIGSRRMDVRTPDAPQVQAAREVGRLLFNALFDERTFARFSSALDQARIRNEDVRIRLYLQDAPELGVFPWEYLYDDSADNFLSLSTNTPIVRFLQLPQPVIPHSTAQPLRILGVVSSPGDLPALDIEAEQSRLNEAVAQLVGRGQAGVWEIEWLQEATLLALRRALRQKEFHILHFIGHGVYDQAQDAGALVFQDERGGSHYVTASQLSTLLRDRTSLRLAVLNACEGARTGIADPFAGVAPALVRAGLPATVAMQFEVTDEAAITFAREFYGAVADGLPVHAALTEARMSIYLAGNAVEWATPVLYTRVDDGFVFRLPAHLPETSVDAQYEEVGRLLDAQQWIEAQRTWRELLRMQPDYVDSRSYVNRIRAGLAAPLRPVQAKAEPAPTPAPGSLRRLLLMGSLLVVLLAIVGVAWQQGLLSPAAAPSPTVSAVTPAVTTVAIASPTPAIDPPTPAPPTSAPTDPPTATADPTIVAGQIVTQTVTPVPISTPVIGTTLFPADVNALWRYNTINGSSARVRLMEQREPDGISLVQVTEADNGAILRFRWFRWQNDQLLLRQEQMGIGRDPSVFSPPLPFLKEELVQSWTWPITNETIIRNDGTRATAFINGNTQVVGLEPVSVPAGNFVDAVHVRYNRIRVGAAIESIVTDIWFVTNIGIVRERTTINERLIEEFVLTEFSE